MSLRIFIYAFEDFVISSRRCLDLLVLGFCYHFMELIGSFSLIVVHGVFNLKISALLDTSKQKTDIGQSLFCIKT